MLSHPPFRSLNHAPAFDIPTQRLQLVYPPFTVPRGATVPAPAHNQFNTRAWPQDAPDRGVQPSPSTTAGWISAVVKVLLAAMCAKRAGTCMTAWTLSLDRFVDTY